MEPDENIIKMAYRKRESNIGKGLKDKKGWKLGSE